MLQLADSRGTVYTLAEWKADITKKKSNYCKLQYLCACLSMSQSSCFEAMGRIVMPLSKSRMMIDPPELYVRLLIFIAYVFLSS